jgi:hypothetical protein
MPLNPAPHPPHQVAEEVESQLQKYKAAVDEINAKTGGEHDNDTNGEAEGEGDEPAMVSAGSGGDVGVWWRGCYAVLCDHLEVATDERLQCLSLVVLRHAVVCCGVKCAVTWCAVCVMCPVGVIDHEELLRRNTQHLMSAVSSLPELQVGVAVCFEGRAGAGCRRVKEEGFIA